MWFSLTSLTESIDAPTLARGLGVSRMRKVRSMLVELGASGESGHWQFTGQAQGTRRHPYQVTVDLHLMPDNQTLDRWSSRCNCPVAGRCKHAKPRWPGSFTAALPLASKLLFTQDHVQALLRPMD